MNDEAQFTYGTGVPDKKTTSPLTTEAILAERVESLEQALKINDYELLRVKAQRDHWKSAFVNAMGIVEVMMKEGGKL